MARLHPLAWHHGARSNSVCETSPTRATGRGLQVERCHGIASTIGSANDIIPEPSPVSVHSTAGFDSPTSHAATCVGTDASSAPAVFATDEAFDF